VLVVFVELVEEAGVMLGDDEGEVGDNDGED